MHGAGFSLRHEKKNKKKLSERHHTSRHRRYKWPLIIREWLLCHSCGDRYVLIVYLACFWQLSLIWASLKQPRPQGKQDNHSVSASPSLSFNCNILGFAEKASFPVHSAKLGAKHTPGFKDSGPALLLEMTQNTAAIDGRTSRGSLWTVGFQWQGRVAHHVAVHTHT